MEQPVPSAENSPVKQKFRHLRSHCSVAPQPQIASCSGARVNRYGAARSNRSAGSTIQIGKREQVVGPEVSSVPAVVGHDGVGCGGLVCWEVGAGITGAVLAWMLQAQCMTGFMKLNMATVTAIQIFAWLPPLS